MSQQDKPPDYYPIESREDVNILYSCSYEFIRYLANTYGEDKVWNVVQAVGKGSDFNDAFIGIFSKTYIEAYRDFLESFF